MAPPKKLAMAQLRKPLEPRLKKLGVAWEDLKSALELIDSEDELREHFKKSQTENKD